MGNPSRRTSMMRRALAAALGGEPTWPTLRGRGTSRPHLPLSIPGWEAVSIYDRPPRCRWGGSVQARRRKVTGGWKARFRRAGCVWERAFKAFAKVRGAANT